MGGGEEHLQEGEEQCKEVGSIVGQARREGGKECTLEAKGEEIS